MPAIERDDWHTSHPNFQHPSHFSQGLSSRAHGKHVVRHNLSFPRTLKVPCTLRPLAMAKGQGVKLRPVGNHGSRDQAIGLVCILHLPQSSQHIVHQSLGTALRDEIVCLLMSQHITRHGDTDMGMCRLVQVLPVQAVGRTRHASKSNAVLYGQYRYSWATMMSKRPSR